MIAGFERRSKELDPHAMTNSLDEMHDEFHEQDALQGSWPIDRDFCGGSGQVRRGDRRGETPLSNDDQV